MWLVQCGQAQCGPGLDARGTTALQLQVQKLGWPGGDKDHPGPSGLQQVGLKLDQMPQIRTVPGHLNMQVPMALSYPTIAPGDDEGLPAAIPFLVFWTQTVMGPCP